MTPVPRRKFPSLQEDWIIYRMVRSRRLLSLVLVAIGVDRRIQKGK
jgi:hypothetical protein